MTCVSRVVCRQVVGDDFHVSAIVGAQNMETDAEDFGIDAAWVQNKDSPDHIGSKAGDPTAVVLNSQHVCSLSLTCSPSPSQHGLLVSSWSKHYSLAIGCC